jgi:4-hydroxy-2-oxoglutarate aldolase
MKGFLIAGSTGEGPYLEVGERLGLLNITREELGARPFILTGIAAESLRLARAQADEAAAAGTDAILAMTPTSLARGNHSAVSGFFEELAEGSPVPVYLYSVPAVTGYTLPVESAVRLSHHPNIAGMKDSGGDPVAMARLVEECSQGFVLMTGSSKALMLCMAAGAHGAITASSNYVPELVLDVVKSARRSLRSAATAQSRLTRLSVTVEAHRVPGVKAAAELTGLWVGYPRKPLKRLPVKERREIEKLLRDEGLI